jgi:coiled-coil domain-containing protein 63/114
MNFQFSLQLHRDVSSIRENEITESSYKETIGNGRKNVVKLENRLDVITKRCGSVMAENAKLREIIDHMLQERSSFNVMWQRMINKLNYGKRFIMDLVEQAANAFDQRDELCSKLQILKERGLNDKQNHVQEMRELQRMLDHDVKLQEFLAIKGQQRLNTEQQEREADKKKKRTEEMERQLVEYDRIFQRIVVSLALNIQLKW